MLCSALARTDRTMLFRDYVRIAPDEAPVLEIVEDNSPSPAEDVIRRRVLAVVELLPGESLREFARIGEGMLHGRQPAA